MRITVILPRCSCVTLKLKNVNLKVEMLSKEINRKTKLYT